MHAVQVLNHYRLALSSDQFASLVMAWIEKEDGLTEEELIAKSKRPEAETKKQVDKLFRASYIRRAPGGRWHVTDVGQMVLEGIGLTKAVSEHLIDDAPLGDTTRKILSLYVQSVEDSESDRPRLYMLKTISDLRKKLTLKSNLDQLQRFYYAAIVGLDAAAYLGIPDSSKWLAPGFTLPSKSPANLTEGLLPSEWEQACNAAVADVRHSDMWLAGESEDAADFIKTFSFARLASAVACKRLDSPLRRLSRSLSAQRFVTVNYDRTMEASVGDCLARSVEGYARETSFELRRRLFADSLQVVVQAHADLDHHVVVATRPPVAYGGAGSGPELTVQEIEYATQAVLRRDTEWSSPTVTTRLKRVAEDLVRATSSQVNEAGPAPGEGDAKH